jgi:protein TonB
VASYDQPKKSNMMPAIIGIVVVVLAAAAFFMFRGKGNTAAPVTTTAAKPVAAAPSTTTAPAAALPLTTSAPTAPTTTSLDQAKVDAEVKKRLDAERQRLEQQTKPGQPATQQAAPAAAPVVSRPTPVPPPVQAAQQNAVAPPPAPVPVAPAPQPVVESRPAPQPAAAEAPRIREGDMVAPGTEGLTPARITRQANPIYPPLARAQRVEGTVIVSVLVSEAGRVLDAKVLSGVNRPVGINESALQTVRNSSFAPGMKEGVRVKSWTTVVVAFKL